MITPESYEFRPGRMPREVSEQSGSVSITKLERAASGSWSGVIRIALEFKLADGRTVYLDKETRIRGRQEGRRPNPAQFERKKKRKKEGKQ